MIVMDKSGLTYERGGILNLYENSIQKELTKWHTDMKKPPTYFDKISKTIQTKTQALIPTKIQNTITHAIRGMTQSIMLGSGLITGKKLSEKMTLSESDWLVERAYKVYNKTAVAQGIGFGAGGILLGMADFPALLSIKVKFLFECAKIYGYDTNEDSERLYLLYIFQLAFSSDKHRLKIYKILMNWDSMNMSNTENLEINWEKFQTEYRDYIDIAKMLQLLPVVGAAFGGVANFKLLEKLKITAMNCYRTRYLMSEGKKSF